MEVRAGGEARPGGEARLGGDEGPAGGCAPDRDQVFYRGKHVIALWDGFLLSVRRRHVARALAL